MLSGVTSSRPSQLHWRWPLTTALNEVSGATCTKPHGDRVPTVPQQHNTHRAAGIPPPAGFPSAAQERQASARRASCRRSVPRCAAEPCLAASPRKAAQAACPRVLPRTARRTRYPLPHSSSGSVERCSWPPPWQSSGSVERCTSRAQHHGCDEGLLPGPSAA